MRRSRDTAVAAAVLLIASCAGSGPRWAEQLSAQLRCGMSLDEVRRLTSKELHPSNSWWTGVYVDGARSDLWLYLDEQKRVESTQVVRVDGWRVMATTSTPRHNICTDQLFFRVRLVGSLDLDGAVVSLDGVDVSAADGLFEVSTGQHTIEVARPGHAPIVRRVEFGAEDNGDQRVDLGDGDASG